jgi:hypothetical protein
MGARKTYDPNRHWTLIQKATGKIGEKTVYFVLLLCLTLRTNIAVRDVAMNFTFKLSDWRNMIEYVKDGTMENLALKQVIKEK